MVVELIPARPRNFLHVDKFSYSNLNVKAKEKHIGIGSENNKVSIRNISVWLKECSTSFLNIMNIWKITIYCHTFAPLPISHSEIL